MPLLLIYSLLPKLYKYSACSTSRTYLKKLQSQQKHAIRIFLYENKFAHTEERFKENNVLNIYQLNIFNNLFLCRVKNRKALNVFFCKLLRPSHHYPTSFSRNYYIVPSFKLTESKYSIKIRAPKL